MRRGQGIGGFLRKKLETWNETEVYKNKEKKKKKKSNKVENIVKTKKKKTSKLNKRNGVFTYK